MKKIYIYINFYLIHHMLFFFIFILILSNIIIVCLFYLKTKIFTFILQGYIINRFKQASDSFKSPEKSQREIKIEYINS